MMTDITKRTVIASIETHLQAALGDAINLQAHVMAEEGDSDLYRKIAFYLVPSLQHWITGVQAGNMKDLGTLLTEREQPAIVEADVKKKK